MNDADNILTKKVQTSRVSRSPVTQLDLIGDAFVRALDERLRELLRTITSSMVLDCEVRKLSAVLDEIPVPAMLALIRVERCKDQALVNISNDLLYHLVDLRLGGDPAAAPAANARAITGVDQALCTDFIDCVLESFSRAMSMVLGTPELAGMSLAEFEQHVTLVNIAPDNTDVLIIKASLDIGEAARSGDVDLIIPLSVLDSFKSVSKTTESALEEDFSADLWQAHMKQVASQAAAEMHCILHRTEMQVAEIQQLRAGDRLEIPVHCLGSVSLTIDGLDGRGTVARGRLGNYEGCKAVKLTEPPSEDLQANLKKSISHGEASY